VAVSVSVVRGADGEPFQLSVNVLDVTVGTAAQAERRARREADVSRRAAEDTSRAKSEFLTAVSHEMRTPLQAITGYAELLDTPGLPADRRSQAPARIGAAAADLLSLVNNTLDVTSGQGGAVAVTCARLAGLTHAVTGRAREQPVTWRFTCRITGRSCSTTRRTA